MKFVVTISAGLLLAGSSPVIIHHR